MLKQKIKKSAKVEAKSYQSIIRAQGQKKEIKTKVQIRKTQVIRPGLNQKINR